ncbi:hypothetical protein T10_6566 [Trichinella papuae]|uniref:Uncharacterized protein n=1 Tax=Trichinella papuae TaxID=268474 RepID=A0A0V1MSK7_9BILA|nr:hypothetical protein T10_6566 [Trichinella papuae]
MNNESIFLLANNFQAKHYLIEHVKKPQALCQPAAEVDKQKCAQLLHRVTMAIFCFSNYVFAFQRQSVLAVD